MSSEHKDLLKAEGNTNIDARHAERFPRWFENPVSVKNCNITL